MILNQAKGTLPITGQCQLKNTLDNVFVQELANFKFAGLVACLNVGGFN